MEGMYAYYRRQETLPTFADLRDEPDVARYAAARATAFRERLQLPIRFFAGADVLEFGPDSGENALVFALWGARLTLVEPNERAHGAIRDYFARFGLTDSLSDLTAADVLAYRDERRYDAIVAEGFIYTVRPTRAWLTKFRTLLEDDGLFVVSYMERLGSVLELALRALHRMHRRRTGLDATASAERLYRAKWDSIPHTRAFASWVMDVLENPFVRASTFIDARAFLTDLDATGFDLYASHPHYDDVLNVEWYKRPVPAAERIARAHRHLERSALSFLAGRKLYIGDLALARTVGALADGAIADVDLLVERDDPAAAHRAADALDRLAEAADAPSVVADGPAERAAARAAFASFARAFRLAGAGDTDGLAAHAGTDRAFIDSWGLPVHLAIGRARPESAAR